MPIIIVETLPKGSENFQFIQSVFSGASSKGDRITEYKCPSRLLAAIVNVGMACRFLVDEYSEWSKIIEIVSDQDGKDFKYDGEHDILYKLLFPANDYEARKVFSLYGEYIRLLDRIQQLRREASINIRLIGNGEDSLTGVPL